MSNRNEATRVEAVWERPVIGTGKGETFLVVRVTAGRTENPARVPVDLALVIDRSGSMAGGELELAKAGVRTALDLLRPEDRASVIAYDHEVGVLGPLAAVGGSSRRRLEAQLDRLEARGSTDLFGGWVAGCEVLMDGEGAGREDRGGRRVRRVLLLTDGHANVGTTDPGEIAHHVTQLRLRGISTSTLGVGIGFEEELLSGMAEAGGGNFAFTDDAGMLPAFFARELGELLTVSALETRLTLTLPKGLRATLLNPYPVERVKKTLTVPLGDLPAGLTVPLVFSVTGRFREPSAVGPVVAELDWAEMGRDGRRAATVEAPALAVVSPAAFERTRRDDEASGQVARIRAERAKREAIVHYRAGRVAAAHGVLHEARVVAMAAPMAAEETVDELDQLLAADPSAPAFEQLRRQTFNDAHRRSRGREA